METLLSPSTEMVEAQNENFIQISSSKLYSLEGAEDSTTVLKFTNNSMHFKT